MMPFENSTLKICLSSTEAIPIYNYLLVQYVFILII